MLKTKSLKSGKEFRKSLKESLSKTTGFFNSAYLTRLGKRKVRRKFHIYLFRKISMKTNIGYLYLKQLPVMTTAKIVVLWNFYHWSKCFIEVSTNNLYFFEYHKMSFVTFNIVIIFLFDFINPFPSQCFLRWRYMYNSLYTIAFKSINSVFYGLTPMKTFIWFIAWNFLSNWCNSYYKFLWQQKENLSFFI